MTEEDFLKKYGTAKLTFVSLFKSSLYMQNIENNIIVHGTSEYRSDIQENMDVLSFFSEVMDFSFEINK